MTRARRPKQARRRGPRIAIDDAPAPDLDALDPEAPIGFARGDTLAGIDGRSPWSVLDASGRGRGPTPPACARCRR
ncbi:MAG TPA: hypothetical protein VFZ28_00710 [Burkholderiaceae bacterium]|nr:hypothetical protein [Burkholderiaceae bacterium]